MTAQPAQSSVSAAARRRTRLLLLIIVSATILVFVGANAHLFYVAFNSQPDCVGHLKTGHSQTGSFAAAESAC